MRRSAAYCAILWTMTFLGGCGNRKPEPTVSDLPPSESLPADAGADGGLVRPGKPIDLVEPEVTATLGSAPAEGELALPATAGAWPWNLRPATPTAPSRAISIPCPKGKVSGLAAAPAVHRLVVTVGDTPSGSKPWTQVFVCDTATGNVAEPWTMKDHYEIIDLSPNGQQMLCRRVDPRARDLLSLWTITDDGKLKSRTWQPHDVSRDPSATLLVGAAPGSSEKSPDRDVVWAGFVGKGRLATSSRAGQFRVWDISRYDRIDRVGSCQGVAGHPAVTPEGSLVAFLAPVGVTLVDPADCRVVGVKEFHPPAGPRVLTFRSDARLLSCVTPTHLVHLDLETGQTRELMRISGDGSSKTAPVLGWTDDYLVIGDELIDASWGAPVGRFRGVEQLSIRDGNIWAALSPKEEKVAIRSYQGVSKKLTSVVAECVKKGDLFALKPGQKIRADVSSILPEKQGQVRLDVEMDLLSLGYKQGDDNDLVLKASEDQTGEKKLVDYSTGHRFEYTERFARLTLLQKGKPIWEVSATTPPPASVTFGGKKADGTAKNPADVAAELKVGSPLDKLFSTFKLPTYLPGAGYPRHGFVDVIPTPEGLLIEKARLE